MTYEFRLPQISMGMQEAVINEWFKGVGDVVAEGDVLVEVEAEKGIVEVEAPASGVLTEICVQAGEVAAVLSVLARIGESAAGAGSDVPEVETPGSSVDRDVTRIPLQGMRGTIARRMHESLQRAAQLTLTREVDVTELLAARNGVSLTDLVSRACVLALTEHPHLNAWVIDDELLLQPEVHLGCAVDLQAGLVVPVVRGAHALSLRELAVARAAAVQEVRAGRFSPAAVSGSTFTVSNLGAEGIDAFTPILNLPEVAILGVGRTSERAARSDQGVAWRTVLTLSLTFDHRALDGAPAARFLAGVASRLEAPSDLIAEAETP